MTGEEPEISETSETENVGNGGNAENAANAEPYSPFAAWRYGIGAKALALAGFAALLLVEGDPTTISGHTIMPTGFPTTLGGG